MLNFINPNFKPFSIILSFLEPDHISNLKSAYHTQIDQYTIEFMQNHIHFKKYINFDHTLNLMWGYTKAESMGQQNSPLVTESRIHLTSIKQMRSNTTNLQKLLRDTLSRLMSSDASRIITQKIFEAFRQGPMIIPPLRRDQVGFNAQTSLQYFYADLVSEESELENLDYDQMLQRQMQMKEHKCQQMDIRLCKKYTHLQMIQLNKVVMSNFSKLISGYDTHLLKIICYQPERITQFNNTGCILLDLITTILLISRNHAQQVKMYLNEIPDMTERMLYYLSYYSNYRKSIVWIQQKMGHQMECLNSILVRQYEHLKHAPPNNFVTPMTKQWYVVMRDLHQEFNRIFTCLLMKFREDAVQKQLKSMQIDKNLETQGQQLNSFYTTLKKHINLKDGTFLSILQKNRSALKYNINQYKQYLVDLSVSCLSVCFNNHSSQKMGVIYNKVEEDILEMSNAYFNYLKNKYKQVTIVKKLLNRDAQTCNFILRPNTTKKILVELNKFLEGLKTKSDSNEEMNACTSILMDFAKEDYRIKRMNNNMGISMVERPEYDFILDVGRTVDLEELDRVFKQLGEQMEIQ